jgi:hypothetical protein
MSPELEPIQYKVARRISYVNSNEKFRFLAFPERDGTVFKL